MRAFVTAVLAVAGVVHMLPATGAVGARSLARLYDVEVEDPDVVLLLRHRAVLFVVVGAILLAGALEASFTTPALAVGLASTTSFLVLARLGPAPNRALRRVAAIDVPLALALTVALAWQLTSAS